jgi:hypothetical protein
VQKEENLEILGCEPILTRSGLHGGEQRHHTKAPRQVPFHANTAALTRTNVAAASSYIEKMLHERHLTSAPRAVNVLMRITVWMLMYVLQRLRGAEFRAASLPPLDLAPCARSPPTTCRVPCTRPRSSRRRAPWRLAVSRMRADALERKPCADGGKEQRQGGTGQRARPRATRVFALPIRSKQLNPPRPFRLSKCERVQ